MTNKIFYLLIIQTLALSCAYHTASSSPDFSNDIAISASTPIQDPTPGYDSENIGDSNSSIKNDPILTPIGTVNADGSVIKSRSTMSLDLGTTFAQQAQDIGILIVNTAYTTVTIDNSHMIMPSAIKTVLSLGQIRLTELSDNNLAVCGKNGTTKCGHAVIRIYTLQTSNSTGPGMYNISAASSATISAGRIHMAAVGLNPSGATIIQSIRIPSNTHLLTLKDFQNPHYNIQVDFSNAVAGTYSATLIVEYMLML